MSATTKNFGALHQWHYGHLTSEIHKATNLYGRKSWSMNITLCLHKASWKSFSGSKVVEVEERSNTDLCHVHTHACTYKKQDDTVRQWCPMSSLLSVTYSRQKIWCANTSNISTSSQLHIKF